MILLYKRKLKSKTEASILSLHVSTIRLFSRIKDYQSRTETTVYIILTTTNPVHLKAENCCGFKWVLAYVGKTWSESSGPVQQNVLKEMFVPSLIAKTGAPSLWITHDTDHKDASGDHSLIIQPITRRQWVNNFITFRIILWEVEYQIHN